MSAVTWPMQRAVLLRAPIPVWAAVLRRRRWSFSAFRSRTRDRPQGAAALRDSDAAYTRAPGTNARTFAAETMAAGRRYRALQRAADARQPRDKRTASWLAHARLGLDCHEFPSVFSRACARDRLVGAAAACALCAPHSLSTTARSSHTRRVWGPCANQRKGPSTLYLQTSFSFCTRERTFREIPSTMKFQIVVVTVPRKSWTLQNLQNAQVLQWTLLWNAQVFTCGIY